MVRPGARSATALLALAFVVGACSGGGGSPSPSSPESSGGGASAPAGSPDASVPGSAAPVEVSGDIFAFGGSYETADEIGKERVDYFRENHKDVKVTFSEAGFDDQQFLAALASGTVPDVARIPRIRIGSYIARGVIEPLDQCLTQTGADMKVFYDAAIAPLQVDGKYYGFPEFLNTRVWILNNKAFTDAGLDPAAFDPASWDSIKAANDKLVKGSGDKLTRIGIDPKIPEFLPLWAKANGADLLSADGKTSQLDDPKVAEAVDFANSLVQAQGGFAPFKSFRDTWDFFGAKNQVASDQIGAWPMEQWYINVLASNSPDAEITVKPFMTKDGQEITYADGDAWAIVKGTRNYAAACQFAYEMTSKDAWVRAAEKRAELRKEKNQPNTGVYSANREADKVTFGEIVDLSSMPTFKAAVDTVVALQDKAFALPGSPAGTEFVDAMTQGVNDVLSGAANATDALAQADQDAQQAIDDAGQ